MEFFFSFFHHYWSLGPRGGVRWQDSHLIRSTVTTDLVSPQKSCRRGNSILRHRRSSGEHHHSTGLYIYRLAVTRLPAGNHGFSLIRALTTRLDCRKSPAPLHAYACTHKTLIVGGEIKLNLVHVWRAEKECFLRAMTSCAAGINPWWVNFKYRQKYPSRKFDKSFLWIHDSRKAVIILFVSRRLF